MFDKLPETNHCCYVPWQKSFKRLKKEGFKFPEGIPQSEPLPKWFSGGGVLVLDDLLGKGISECWICLPNTLISKAALCFTCARSLSEQEILQDHFLQCTLHREVQVPAGSIGDTKPVTAMFPTRWQDVLDMFRKVIERPFAYMLFNVHPASHDDQHNLSHLLKHERFMRCYQLTQSC